LAAPFPLTLTLSPGLVFTHKSYCWTPYG
jgi:hypothetical protein